MAIDQATVATDDDPGPIRLRVRGSICRAPGGRWIDLEGHQSFETDGLSLRWQARLRLARLAWIDAEDRLDAEGGYGGPRPGASLQAPEQSKEKADMLHAIYDLITVAGPEIVGVRLTQAAYAHGLALALPEKAVMARPTSAGRGLPTYAIGIGA